MDRNPEDLSAFERQIATIKPFEQAVTRPPRTTIIKPEEWSSSWEKRPATPIVVGLRLLSASDVETAELEAQKAAENGGERAYHETGVAFTVARGICDPNNVAKPHPRLEFAEDMVPLALNKRTIARLFDELERLAVDTVPIYAEATEENIRDLCIILSVDDPFADIDPVRAARARRYLKFALDELIDS